MNIYKSIKKLGMITITALSLLITATPANAFALIEKPANSIEITENTAISSNPYTERTINPRESETIHINYCINREAYVTVAIYESTGRISYNKLKTLTDYQLSSPGCYDLEWNGTDNRDRVLVPGKYYYGINAVNADFRDDTDYAAEWLYVKYPHGYETCYSYESSYCEAINYVLEEEIFVGYRDGSFRADQPISRAEALKSTLKAMDIAVSNKSEHQATFWDVNYYHWALPYVYRAVQLHIIHGYDDGSFRPNQTVNKAEALKMVLLAGHYSDGLSIPDYVIDKPYLDTPINSYTYWYLPYAVVSHKYALNADSRYLDPQRNITRGEFADILYRYHLAGLDR